MLFRASAAEINMSKAPLSEPVWLEWEGLADEVWPFHGRGREEWVEAVPPSSGPESVRVLSLPDSSADPVSAADTLSIASPSPSLPSPTLSPSLSPWGVSPTDCVLVFPPLFRDRGVGGGAGLRLAAFLWAFSAFCNRQKATQSHTSSSIVQLIG